MYLELDEDHLAELEAIVQDYGVGNMDYAPIEKFEAVEIFAGDFSEEQLDRFKEIVQAALSDEDYSSSLMGEIIERIEKSKVLAGMSEPDDDEDEDEDRAGDDIEAAMFGHRPVVDEEDELKEGDEALLARVRPPAEAFAFRNPRSRSKRKKS